MFTKTLLGNAAESCLLLRSNRGLPCYITTEKGCLTSVAPSTSQYVFVLKNLFPHKLSAVRFTNPTSAAEAELNLRWSDGHRTWTSDNLKWSDESSFMQFPTSGRVYVWRTPKEACNSELIVPTAKRGEDLAARDASCESHLKAV
jgi:hypothetical protein